MTVAMNLRTFLEQTGISITDFAREIGVYPQAVHRYLRGERMPRPDVMRLILKATDGAVTADSFLLQLVLPKPRPRKAA
jgi:transcriptional regulator with XRE-family HTH domain